MGDDQGARVLPDHRTAISLTELSHKRDAFPCGFPDRDVRQVREFRQMRRQNTVCTSVSLPHQPVRLFVRGDDPQGVRVDDDSLKLSPLRLFSARRAGRYLFKKRPEKYSSLFALPQCRSDRHGVRPGQVLSELLREPASLLLSFSRLLRQRAVNREHGLGELLLDDDAVFFPGEYSDHSRAGPHTGLGAQERRAAHGVASRDDEHLAEGSLVASRISLRKQFAQVAALGHDHLRHLPSAAGKTPVVNTDRPQDRLAAVIAPGIQEMAALIVGEGHCEVAADRASHHGSVFRGDPGREVQSHNGAPCLRPEGVHFLRDLRGLPRKGPAQSGSEERVDDDGGPEAPHLPGVEDLRSRSVGLEDLSLRHGRRPFRRIFGTQEQELHLITLVCQKSSDGKPVRTVIARTRQNSDAPVRAEAGRDLLCDGKRRPLHQNDGRNPYDLGGGAVRLRHFSTCEQIFHDLSFAGRYPGCAWLAVQ